MSLVSVLPSWRARQRAGRPDPWRLLILLGLSVLSLAFVLPLWLVISASLTDDGAITRNGYTLLPSQFSAFAYQYILSDPAQIVQAYGVSTLVTVLGSALSLTILALAAYPLSRWDYALRRPFSFYIFFTMLFNGGLVPFYILVTQYLHLSNTIWALILPYLVIPWYLLLLRTFFAALPQELVYAAKIDGASEWHIFFQIIVPLSKPALATVGLFIMLGYWNDWWLALLFIDDPHLSPVQYLLYRLMTNVDVVASQPQLFGVPVPALSIRMAVAVLALVPILVVFLFVQRFFIRGITVGSLKGE
jgi:putative aldouronate transport system permease protein